MTSPLDLHVADQQALWLDLNSEIRDEYNKLLGLVRVTSLNTDLHIWDDLWSDRWQFMETFLAW